MTPPTLRPSPVIFRHVIAPGERRSACDLLSDGTGLSKSRIKEAMNKGAAWTVRGKSRRRLRRASARLPAGSRIELFFEETLLSLSVPDPELMCDARHYSLWYKPAGLLTTGTDFGDHCSLLRRVETFFPRRREAFPVHRLDREAAGLCLVAHTREAAAKLSHLFRERKVEKRYRAEVLGRIDPERLPIRIDRALDGKEALTDIVASLPAPDHHRSLIDIVLHTGRRHQIRRHLEGLGHPVMGDPLYGSGNKNAQGLQLEARVLRYRCPWQEKPVCFDVADFG